MATLTEFFDAEAKRYVERLTELAAAPQPDAAEVYRNARGLRGSAQMAREDRVDQLRHDGVVVAENPREQRFVRSQLADEVGPHLLLDRDGPVAGLTQDVGGGRHVRRRPPRPGPRPRRFARPSSTAAPAVLCP